MDIHKPKPVHSWRELFSEIGVIVVGVLIALSAEQAVEWLHWRERAGFAVQQIEPEIRENMFYMVERVMVERCIEYRLTALEDRLAASSDHWQAVAPMGITGAQAGNVLPVPSRPWPDTAWTAAIADTSATHLDHDRLTFYSRFYREVQRQAAVNQEEFDGIAQLNALARPLKLSNDKAVDLIAVIEKERTRNRSLAFVASQSLDYLMQNGRDPAPARSRVKQRSTTYKACLAAHKV